MVDGLLFKMKVAFLACGFTAGALRICYGVV
jgi:hypothetical protein